MTGAGALGAGPGIRPMPRSAGARNLLFALPTMLGAWSQPMAAAEAAFDLPSGKPMHLVCSTKAVRVATNAAAATTGQASLRLDRGNGGSSSGTWTVEAVDAAHTGAFASQQQATCQQGCPFDVSAKGELQLWAPAAKSLQSLGDDETLLIAVIKPDGLSLRASTFRGKEIEALEEGSCKESP